MRLLTIILLLISGSLFGQTNIDFNKKDFSNNLSGLEDALNNISIGDSYYLIGKGAYIKALPYYIKANSINSKNSELNFKIAMCYLFSDNENEAIKYFRISKNLEDNKKTTTNYYIALSYQRNYQFQKAIDTYNVFKIEIPFFKKRKWNKKVDKRIQECKTAILLTQKPINSKVKNLGNLVNSKNSEHTPFIDKEKILFFTSRKRNGNTAPNRIDSVDFQNYEDVFFTKINEKGLKITNMGKAYNLPEHDALVSISNNGKYAIFYRSTNGGDLFLSTKNKDNKWSEAKVLPEQINSKYHESSAIISDDGNEIYFSSNKNNSNYNIYYSLKNEKGIWSKANMISKTINSEYDEIGLFMHPDGRTLYFSSNGHNNMGGFDIFKSTKNDGKNSWTEPKNLGFPINSADDDMFFMVSQYGQNAYFSSNRKGGEGSLDIYEAIVNDDLYKHTVLKVIIKNNEGKTVDAKVTILANDSININSDITKKGIYKTSIAAGKDYVLTVNAKNYIFHYERFDILVSDTAKEIVRIIKLKKANEGANVVLNDVEFNYASSNLKKSSYKHLDQIALYLISNPNIKFEISGHTDNTGNYSNNKKLSEQRAKSVVDYLISKKVPANQLSYIGHSSDKPIDSNKTPEGRKRNRRVEFKIIKK